MRHNITLDGTAYRLRPAGLADARFIVDLRTDPARNGFIRATSSDVLAQQAWLEAYFCREGDYYFIVERKDTGAREGTIGLYNVDTDVDFTARSAEWGRWIMLPAERLPAEKYRIARCGMSALESANLIYRVAFEVLGLNFFYCRTATDNKNAVAFHDSCGLERHAVLRGSLNLASGPADAVEHRMTSDAWRMRKRYFEASIGRLAERIVASPATSRLNGPGHD